MIFLKYSASIISSSFWFLESKKVAELILEGYSKDEILNTALEDNIFQVETERRIRDITNTAYRRLKSFPEEVLEYFVRVDVNSAKVFVLISILKNDKLFFEFMYEVFGKHIILGDLTLKNKDYEMFFDNKAYQSNIVSEWVDETRSRLKRSYNTMLSEAGVLDTSGKEKVILLPFIDLRFKDILIKNDLGTYLYTITGDE